MIRITAKGLAKYMTSGEASKRKILRDYKFPDPEGAVQIKYYAEARAVIEHYHGSGNDPSIIVSAVDDLNTKASREHGRKHDRPAADRCRRQAQQGPVIRSHFVSERVDSHALRIVGREDKIR